MFLYKFFLNIYNIHKLVISRAPLYGYLIITDSLLCPWKKKALTFSLNSTRLIRTPVNTDNGHFNSCPINRFSRKADIINTVFNSVIDLS